MILAFMEDFSGIQIMLLFMISIYMMIQILQLKPFKSELLNAMETFNEVVIIISCYHLVLMSDFVPVYNFEFK